MQPHEKEAILQPDAVEKYFCIPFLGLKKHLLTDEQMEYIVMIRLMKQEEFNKMEADVYKSVWIYAAMKKRMQLILNVKIDLRILMLVTFTYKNVGINMMFLYALQYWAKKNKRNEVTFDDFCMSIFAEGIPAQSEMHNIWLNQKVKASPDNLIDYDTACKSIML